MSYISLNFIKPNFMQSSFGTYILQAERIKCLGLNKQITKYHLIVFNNNIFLITHYIVFEMQWLCTNSA